MKKRKKNFGEWKLNTKFTVTMLCLIAVPMLVFIMAFFSYTRKTMNNEVVIETRAKMQEDYADIQKMIEAANMSTQVILNDKQLQELLVKLNRGEEIQAGEYVEFSQEHISLLESFINSNPYLYQIRVYANNNEFPEMMPVLYRRERLNKAPWKDTMVSGTWQINYQDFLEEQKEKELMALISEITDYLGTETGVLEVAVAMEDMFPRMYEAGEESWVGFVTEDGAIYSAGDQKKSIWEKEKREIVQKAKNLEENGYINTKILGKEVMIFSQPIKELSGSYILLVNTDEQMKGIFWQQAKIVGILLLLLALLVLLIDESINFLLQKFYEILGVVRNIRNGNLEQRIPVNGKDEMGELEYENFNAASGKVEINGRGVHPGSAKGSMINALLVGMEFQSLLPVFENPMYTEGYEGFFHLDQFRGDVESAHMEYIIRDHDREKFEKKKELFEAAAAYLNRKYGEGTVVVKLKDSYYNMKEKIEPENLYLIDIASEAMKALGIAPQVTPIRGGTDGARLSYMGLPCPNLCTGGYNFHGKYEFIPVQSIDTMVEILKDIVIRFEKR